MTLTLYAITLVLFVVCYAHTFQWLHFRYGYTDSYYSHGYLIPLICGYLVWHRRHYLRTLPLETNRRGLVLMVAALLVHIVGTLGDVMFLSGFSILGLLTGYCLYRWGTRFTKALRFPLCYLVFMFPVPNTILDTIGLPTKTLATDLGLRLVSVLGIPYNRDGFLISLVNASLTVGTPCNGMQSLISFAGIFVLAIYLFNPGPYKSVLLLLIIYPLAIILNGLRIAILVYIAHAYGQNYAEPESFLHDLTGFIVFIIGLTILLVIILIRKTLGVEKRRP